MVSIFVAVFQEGTYTNFEHWSSRHFQPQQINISTRLLSRSQKLITIGDSFNIFVFNIYNDVALHFWTHCITYFRYFLYPFLYPYPIDWPKPCLVSGENNPSRAGRKQPSLRIDFLHIHFPPFNGPESNTFTLRITSSAPLNTTRQELFSRLPRPLSYHKLVVCTSISPM